MLDCLSIEAANTLSPNEYLLPYGEQQQLLESIDLGRMEPYWKRALNHYEINFLIIGRDSRLHLVLNTAKDQGWIKVYEDYAYALYVRDSKANKPLIDKTLSLSKFCNGG